MVEKLYLTEEEASYRYALSKQWFQRERWLKQGPPFIKVKGNGRILYPLKETDEWFMNNSGKETNTTLTNN